MDIYNKIKNLNNLVISIEHVKDKSFLKYGKIISNIDFSCINEYMMNVSDIPIYGNKYVPSVNELNVTETADIIAKNFYGNMPIQIGYCNGNNHSLNGLEYHKSSEINYAVSDMILLLANIWQIENNKFDANDVKAFFVPQGTAIEMYATTLHFAPCKTSGEGFKCVVILPKNTNLPLEGKRASVMEEDELLFMTNKWLIVHPEATKLVNNNAFVGITGRNITINHL
jgi:hypothetical protein